MEKVSSAVPVSLKKNTVASFLVSSTSDGSKPELVIRTICLLAAVGRPSASSGSGASSKARKKGSSVRMYPPKNLV